MTLVILMLTIIDAHDGTLSARQQRMSETECTRQIERAKADARVSGDTVFGGCVPLPGARVLEH